MGFLSGLLGFLLCIWDFVTYPIYFIIDRPWRTTRLIARTRARIVSTGAKEITIKGVPLPSPIRDELKNAPEEINTMERLFKFSSKKHANKKCLGTRQVLGEMEETQTSGKVFTKLQLGEYTWQTYSQVAAKADCLGRGLREIGVKPRDRVVIYANTSADWMICAIGAFRQSLALVTIYTNLGEEGVLHGVTQTETSTIIVGEDLLPKLLAVLPQAPAVKNVIVIPSHNPAPLPPDTATVSFHRFSSILSSGSTSHISCSPPGPQDTAIIMYTSGSTGVPKGVILTHANLLQAVFCLIPTCETCDLRPDDCYLALLPLAHVLELLAENMLLAVGIPIGYSNPKTFLDSSSMVAKGYRGDASVLRPTCVAVVPLVLDSIYKGIRVKMVERGALFTEVVDFCYRYKLKWMRRGHSTPLTDLLVFSKFKAILGGRMRAMLSGGAPLAPDSHDFCRTCLGITLLQGYGLTETCATACVPDGHDLSTGRVGPPLQQISLRLVDWEEGGYLVSDPHGPRGEVVIGGGQVAAGYYNMPEKTREDFFTEHGTRWFRTGDIGQMMPDGTIKIVDRKKDLVKMQGGEYVSLGKVESLMKLHPAVENICVFGDSKRSNPVALVVPGEVWLQKALARMGKDNMSRAEACLDPAVVADVLEKLKKHAATQKLQRFEIPDSIFLVAEPWTPESGLITAAFKLKRKALENTFKDDLVELYAGNNNDAKLKTKNVNNNQAGGILVSSV